MLDHFDLTSIQDERACQLIVRLLNLLEDVTADLRDAQVENQRLRDEIARLKGEQGRPIIKPNIPKSPPTNHSSERERRKPIQRSKGSKNKTIPIDREQVVEVAPLYFGGQMSEPKILELFGSVGVQISEGQLSNLLIKDQDAFHAEKDALYAPSGSMPKRLATWRGSGCRRRRAKR